MTNSFLFIIIILFLLNKNNSVNIKFNVRDENNKAIKGAFIIIKEYNTGNLINVMTCCHGLASFKGIINDSYQVVIYKKGYRVKTFNVNACKDINCNICLCRCVYKVNRLYGYITDSEKKIIDRAAVVLYRVVGERRYVAKRFTYTDFTGEYNFFDIPKGNYIVKAIK